MFGLVQYRIIGDDNAPVYFAIDQNSGEISMYDSVALDRTMVYQVRTQFRGAGKIYYLFRFNYFYI